MKEGPERWKRILDPRCFRSGFLGSGQGATLSADPRDLSLDISTIDFKSPNVISSPRNVLYKSKICSVYYTRHTKVISSEKMIVDNF